MKRFDVTIAGLPRELGGPTRVVTYHGPDETTGEAAAESIETMIRFDAVRKGIDVGPLDVTAAESVHA